MLIIPASYRISRRGQSANPALFTLTDHHQPSHIVNPVVPRPAVCSQPRTSIVANIQPSAGTSSPPEDSQIGSAPTVPTSDSVVP